QCRRIHFPLRVGLEGKRAAAVQRAVKQKVERVEIGQLEAFHSAIDHAPELIRDALLCQCVTQNLVPLRFVGDDADICGVALVTRTRVRDVDESNLHCTSSTLVWTTLLSMSAGQ